MLPSVDVVRDAEEDGDDFVFESMDGEAMSAGPVCGACLSPRLILLPGGTDHCGIVLRRRRGCAIACQAGRRL